MLRNLADVTAADRAWPTPDMTVLNAGRVPPVPMPGALFGRSFSVLQDIAAGTSTPVDYPAMAFLAACASLIGSKRRVKPYPASHWTEPCILWCAVVGDPSARKSPPLDAVTEPLRAIERDYADDHAQALAKWQEEDAVAKIARGVWEADVKAAVRAGNDAPEMPDEANAPQEPVRRRTVVMDATPEALGVILSGNPMGTLHFRDELAGWLMSFDRYAPGGREFWLEAYGGRAFAIDRKGAKDPVLIPFNGVSVLGGIQPAKLSRMLLECEDDGLVARFLLAWPEKRSFTRPAHLAQMDKLETTFRRLDALQFGHDDEGREVPVVLPLSTDAADAFEDWQRRNEQIDHDAGGLFKSFVGKMDGTVLRLALFSKLVTWAEVGGDEPTEISLRSLRNAAEWVDDYAKPMAERVYGDAALPEVERNAAVLARYIRKHGLMKINKRELKRSPHKASLPQLRKAEAMDAAIELLVEAGWLAEEFEREREGLGRRPSTYLVNPLVHGD